MSSVRIQVINPNTSLAMTNMIKMVHQRLAERLQGFIPQQTDQLLVIVATAALSPGGAPGGNH